jgi:AcrR family transcriptional regulator
VTQRVEAAQGRRSRLNRDRVLRTAVGLAEQLGIEALTMRRLGEELGVEAMSLYNHVQNKEDLLNGMINTVFEEIELPSWEDEWKIAMRKRAVSARAALSRHPWATVLMESGTTPGPATLRLHDRVIGVLRAAGFSVPMAAHAFSLINSYIYGFVMQENALPFHSPEETAIMAAAMLAHFPVDTFPHLAEFTAEHVLKPGYDYGDEFEFGLELILDALGRALDSEEA